MSLIWNDRKTMPPLTGKASDGGMSVQLFFRHKSGIISTGQILAHNGRVARVYPGRFEDSFHVSDIGSDDPVTHWALFPSIDEVVQAFS